MDTDIPDSPSNIVSSFFASPFAFQCFSIGVLLFFILGFQPPYSYSGSQQFGMDEVFTSSTYTVAEAGFLQNTVNIRTAGLEEVEITDEDGNTRTIVKPRRREKILQYAVQSGDSITRIAHNFGLKVSTVLWANNLTSRSVLSAGDILRIPPEDGVFFVVREGDTLSEIATSHNMTEEDVLRNNGLKSDSKIKEGDELFLSGAKRMYVKEKEIKEVVVASKPKKKTVTNSGYNPNNITNAPKYIDAKGSGISAGSITLLRPTKGVLTQGYHRNHYALDIANKWNTPIYAAAAGTVVTSNNGWNGGYGNWIIVDHRNGIQTLYGHNNIRKVKVGDKVAAGQLIALMGNTGRVFGRTGIHLHFELRINGRKVNPANYY